MNKVMLSCKATCISSLFLYKWLRKWDPIDCERFWKDTFIKDIKMKVCAFSLQGSKYNSIRHHFTITFLSKNRMQI